MRPVATVIGREVEQAALREFLSSDRELPAALILDGEAGIGKTTLWHAGVEIAQGSHQVLVAQAASAEAEFPFASLSDLLDDRAAEVLPKLPLPQRRALEVALLLAEPGEHAPDPRAIATAFLNVVRLVATDGPVLVALDDIQWIDPPSRRVLEFLVRRLEREPVALLVACRTEREESPPLGMARAFAENRLTELRIGPLSLGALHEVLRARLGLTFARPTLRRIAEASGGNPLFALEIARAVSSSGRRIDPTEPLAIPETLDDLISDRIAGLPAETREALLVAAVAAAPTIELVRAAVSDDPWERLRPALEAEAIEIDGEQIRFTHPLLASATQARADLGQRRDMHSRLGALVSEPEERARHLALAVGAPDESVASAIERGAGRALARGAPDVAAALEESAARLTPALHRDDGWRRIMQAAHHHLHAGALERAQGLLEEVVAEAPAGALRAKALAWQASNRFLQAGGPAMRIEDLQKALADASKDTSLQSGIERGLAWLHQAAGDLASAQQHARAAVELAEHADDELVLAMALATHAFMKFVTGRGLDVELIDRAVRLEPEHTPDGYLRPTSIYIYGLLLEWSGEHERARSLFERRQRESQQRGYEVELPFSMNHLARLALRAGDVARARAIAADVLDHTLQMRLEEEQAYALATVSLVEAHCGNAKVARELTEQGLALAERTAIEPPRFELLAVEGFLDLSLGQAEAAHRVLGPLVEALAAAGFGEPAVFRVEPDDIEALITLGRLEQAEVALDRLLAHARTVPSPWIAAVATRSGGMLEGAHGDARGAVAMLEDAHKKAAALGEPFELARTLLALGSTQRRGKRWAAARHSLEEAKRIFERVGARLWVERTQEELARVPGRRSRGSRLTPTERRVAELVAEGRANKEVAAALFVTVKAVEANLSRVYAKLGIRSRTELAKRFARETEPKL
jgi:DNA-binding CsgD family transcriptional regulator